MTDSVLVRESPARVAWQWTGQPPSEWPAWVRRCADACPSDPEAIVVRRRSGRQWVYPREWLVRDLDGEAEWVGRQQFAASFDVVGGARE